MRSAIVWTLFERFTFEAIGEGREFYSANAIFELVRDAGVVREGGVKLNNNFRAYYARMFHAKHQEHAGFFRNRKRPSEEHAAYEEDIQAWKGEDPGDESALTAKLADL